MSDTVRDCETAIMYRVLRSFFIENNSHPSTLTDENSQLPRSLTGKQ